MAIQIPSASAKSFLDLILSKIPVYIHLFANDVVITEDTVKGDFIEPTWPGYGPMPATGWAPPVWIDDRAFSAADPLRWIYGQSVAYSYCYGYFATNGPTGAMLWAEERPEGPIRLGIPSDTVEVWPRLTLRQDPDPE